MFAQPFFSSPIAALAILMGLTGTAHAQGMATTEVPFTDDVPKTPPQTGARTLLCTLRQATNIDPRRDQSEDDISYAGHYRLTISLPATRLPAVAGSGTGAPDVKPDPAYRVADPDHLFAQFPLTGFDRVADYWPSQVELAQTIGGKVFEYIHLEADPDHPDRTSIFVSRAADAVAVDTTWIFRGACTVTAGTTK